MSKAKGTRRSRSKSLSKKTGLTENQKRAQEEAARLASFPELNPNSIVEVGFDGHILYANPATENTFPGLLKSGSNHPFFSDWESVVRTLQEDKKNTFGKESRIGEHWYHQQFYLVPKSQSVRIYTMDIDELKKAEEEVKAVSRFPAENPNPVMRISRDGVILYCNEAGSRILNEWKCQVGQKAPSDWCQLAADVFESGTGRELEQEHGNQTFLLMVVPISEGGYVNIYGQDITGRKKAETALHQSEEKYRSIVETAQEGITLADSDGRIVFANERVAQLLGYTVEELTGKSGLELLPEGEADAAQERMKKRQKGVKEQYEIMMRRKDGSEVCMLVSGSPVFDAGGQHVANLGMYTDITERKKAERALRESEERFRLVMENSRDGINLLDLKTGRYVFMSPAQVKLTGFTAEEINNISSQEAYERTHPEDRQITIEQQKKAAAGIDVSEPVEYRWKVRSGEYRWFSDSRKLVRDDRGQPIALVGISRDITERKKAEEALRQSERNFKSLAVNAPDVIMRFDTNLRILYLNHQVERATGIPAEQYIGKTNEEMGMPPKLVELWNGMFQNAASSKQLQQAEFDFSSPDGRRTFSLRVVPEFAEDGSLTSFLGISHDITDIKKAEEELRKAHNELELRVDERTKELREASESLRSEIDERKRAEEAVKAERKRFTDVLEKLPAYLILLTPDHHVSYANRFFRERFGENRDDKCCYEYLFNRSAPCDNCETYKTLEKMAPIEWEWTGPDGHNYYIYDSPFTDLDGSTVIMEVGIDITERKIVENKLQAASLYSRSLIEASLDPLVTISAEGKITDVNKATEEATGFSREQLIGRDFSDYFTDPEEARTGYQQVFKEGFVRDYPLAIRHKSGKITNVLYNATVYRNEVGDVQGVFAVARDVTERKKAEDALKKAHAELETRVEERTRDLTEASWKLQAEIGEHKRTEENLRQTSDYLENLFDHANAPIIVWDSDYHITRFNHAFERLTGLKASDVLGKPLEILFPVDSKEESLRYISRASSGEYWQVVEIPILRTDGNVRTVLWNSANIYGKDGTKVNATIAQGQDITERKLVEKALRESEGDLNRAQAVAMTGSWRLDVQRDELLWSDETYRMFGIPKGTHLTYEAFLSHVHPDDRDTVDETWKATMRGEPYDIEHRIIVDGRVKWVREKAELELNKDGAVMSAFGTVQDVTERREMHAKLEEYSKHLEQLVEEKTQKLKEAERMAAIGETAGMVGHDIRNPLQSIEGAVYLAKEEIKAMPAESQERKELQEIIDIIHNQTNYIDHIVAELQDFARTPKPQPREVDVQELVTDSLSMIEIPEKVAVQTAFQEDLSKLTVDPVFMKRVIVNLIENAVQAMPNGGKLILKVFCDEESTYICVEDTGVGIPEEHKPKMFSPLFTTKAKGQGFGLSVCKKLVEAHNGEITYESKPGNTTFKVKLPLEKRVK